MDEDVARVLIMEVEEVGIIILNRYMSCFGLMQTPDQALYSRSVQILKTIPRFQYEALSWVPNLLKVQDTEQELNKEEEEEYEHDILPIEVDRVKYSNIETYRIGIFGDVGQGLK